MDVLRHPHGVAIIPPDEAWDENLPGQINLTWDEAYLLYQKLGTTLRGRD